MSVELKITMKDDERKLTKDFLIYEKITFDQSDPTIIKCMQEVREEFKGDPTDIKVKGTMVLK
jgi:hypothetical protein